MALAMRIPLKIPYSLRMPTWKDVTTIALALPKTEVSMWYGTPGVKVAGNGSPFFGIFGSALIS